jgi:hypothetical protein
MVSRMFTIDPDNNFTVLAEVPAGTDRSTVFSTEKELAKLISNWPASRLIEAWNSFAGVPPFADLKPIEKFTSRKDAVARIWRAIDRLTPLVEPARDTAPAKGIGKKGSDQRKRRDTPRLPANTAAPVARSGSKSEIVINLLKRSDGANSKDLMEATGCQGHSVRGFLSGTVGKMMGLSVTSTKGDDGERRYSMNG